MTVFLGTSYDKSEGCWIAIEIRSNIHVTPTLCCDEAADPFGDRDEASLEDSLLGSPPQAERQRLWQGLVELASHNAEAEELLERISSQNGAVQSDCERVSADEVKQGCMSIELLERLQVACGSLFPPVGKCRTVSMGGTPGFLEGP